LPAGSVVISKAKKRDFQKAGWANQKIRFHVSLALFIVKGPFINQTFVLLRFHLAEIFWLDLKIKKCFERANHLISLLLYFW